MNSGSVIVIAAMLCLLSSPAKAHDHYGNVYEYNGKPATHRLCCGGDEKTGDCEALLPDQIYQMQGGVVILSKRYQARVFVPNSRIAWDYPRDYNTGEPAFPHDSYAGHWCGKPRKGVSSLEVPPTPDQPDPDMWTYCAFVLPGGV